MHVTSHNINIDGRTHLFIANNHRRAPANRTRTSPGVSEVEEVSFELHPHHNRFFTHPLNPVPEMHILLIRQIAKAFQRLNFLICNQAFAVPPLVLSITDQAVHDLKPSSDTVSDEEAFDGAEVARGLRG